MHQPRISLPSIPEVSSNTTGIPNTSPSALRRTCFPATCGRSQRGDGPTRSSCCLCVRDSVDGKVNEIAQLQVSVFLLPKTGALCCLVRLHKCSVLESPSFTNDVWPKLRLFLPHSNAAEANGLLFLCTIAEHRTM